MDITFLQTIIDNDYKLPKGHTVAEITPQLISNLDSINPDLRESSYMVLSGLISAGTGVNYSPNQLREIGKQMAHNLNHGIGEQNSDSVFLRAFSMITLDKVIAVDGIDQYLTELEIREWLEQGLAYFKAEQDLRGYVPERGWAHSIAHAADFFWVITRNRYLNVEDLKCILIAISDKVTEPVAHTYLYQEDDRLAQAVNSALLRDLLDMTFLNKWLNRFVHPPNGVIWSKAFSDLAITNARHNTIVFLRSLYFQLLLGIQYIHHTYTNKTPSVKDELLSSIIMTLKEIDHWVYARKD